MSNNVQNSNATLTWLHDWTARLARAALDLGLTPGSLTISSVGSVTGPANTTITSPTLNTAHTGVTFKLATSLTPPTDVTIVTHVTLSNGDIDEADLIITLVD